MDERRTRPRPQVIGVLIAEQIALMVTVTPAMSMNPMLFLIGRGIAVAMDRQIGRNALEAKFRRLASMRKRSHRDGKESKHPDKSTPQRSHAYAITKARRAVTYPHDHGHPRRRKAGIGRRARRDEARLLP